MPTVSWTVSMNATTKTFATWAIAVKQFVSLVKDQAFDSLTLFQTARGSFSLAEWGAHCIPQTRIRE